MLIIPDPFRGMGVAEDHEFPEAGRFSSAWNRDCRETESRQRASDLKSP